MKAGEEMERLVRLGREGLRWAEVTADGSPIAERPSRRTVRETILPLLLWCQKNRPKAARGLVGVVGPPGSGKSTLLAWLSVVARVIGVEGAAVAGIDGYHFPNAVLDERQGVAPDGTAVSMRLLKGTPESFDAQRLLEDLQRIRESREPIALPAYSRVLHDPVPNAIRIPAQTEWVFVEGNFLFLDEPPWRQIRDLFDRRIYLDVPEAVTRERLTARHAAGGRSAEWIEAHWRRTDGPNVRRVQDTARFADTMVRCDL